jgi:hypothetical protein
VLFFKCFSVTFRSSYVLKLSLFACFNRFFVSALRF